MILKDPFVISPRLLPALKVGEAWVQLEYSRRPGNEPGRVRYKWTIDLGSQSWSDDDMSSGCQGGTLQEGFASLLSFLGAFAEGRSYSQRTGRESENGDLFPEGLAEWAYQNSDEISSLAFELEEAEEPLIEES